MEFMMRKRLTGMGVALITPFTDSGEVDYATLEKLVEMHLACGTDFLCVLGTTAETPTLTKEEKDKIYNFDYVSSYYVGKMRPFKY